MVMDVTMTMTTTSICGAITDLDPADDRRKEK
jgi:hypothetical protein